MAKVSNAQAQKNGSKVFRSASGQQTDLRQNDPNRHVNGPACWAVSVQYSGAVRRRPATTHMLSVTCGACYTGNFSHSCGDPAAASSYPISRRDPGSAPGHIPKRRDAGLVLITGIVRYEMKICTVRMQCTIYTCIQHVKFNKQSTHRR